MIVSDNMWVGLGWGVLFLNLALLIAYELMPKLSLFVVCRVGTGWIDE